MFAMDGSQMARAQLTFRLSSVYVWQPSQASNCNDGNLANFCASGADGFNDPNPTLFVSYVCSNGITDVSRVVVYNRQDGTAPRILPFQMVFLDANGNASSNVPSYRFTESRGIYTVDVACEWPGQIADRTACCVVASLVAVVITARQRRGRSCTLGVCSIDCISRCALTDVNVLADHTQPIAKSRFNPRHPTPAASHSIRQRSSCMRQTDR